MFEMVKASIVLFLRGRLFQNPNEVMRQLAIGIALTLVVFLLALKLAGLAPVIAAAVASFVGGAAQPALFRNLKFR
ncbi:hypothetical protein RUR49_19660 [Pseudoxanthobacter sp. M-2]|uniref:hypothetical protein n=1 Tax=Pseudoxanthobacter sp. M-2 TaxID=3078754 RepID=UPI0038FC5EDB